MANSKLTTIAFRCNQDEGELLKELAAAADCTVSKFVHDLVINTIKGDLNNDASFPLILSPEMQQTLLRMILIQSIHLQKRMIEDGSGELFDAISDKAKQLVDEGILTGKL